MKWFLKIIVLICFLSLSISASAQETVRLTNGEWPPWLSHDLKHYGVVSHIVTTAFALEGIKVEYGFFPWKRAMIMAKNGSWDGSVVWSKTDEREEDFYFSDVVVEGVTVFFYLKKNKFDWSRIDDLKGLIIGATMGYNYGDLFESAERTHQITVERVPRDELNFKKLLTGRIDVFPLDIDIGTDMLRKNFSAQEARMVTYHVKPLRVTGYHLMMSKKVKNSKELLMRFNQGLSQMKTQGLIQKYLNDSRNGAYELK